MLCVYHSDNNYTALSSEFWGFLNAYDLGKNFNIHNNVSFKKVLNFVAFYYFILTFFT
jgi:hypothetical protein